MLTKFIYTYIFNNFADFQWNKTTGMEEGTESPLRKSLFSNIPPYLNYLPNGRDMAQAGPCQSHVDTMVDLR